MTRRRFVLLLLCGAGLFLALRAAFTAAGALQVLYGGGYGIRANAPLSEAQREGAAATAAELGAAAAFWGETHGTVKTENSTAPAAQAETEIVVYAGEPALALGAVYRYGRAPAAGETDVCAVSLPLAEALWGGQDVTGLVLTWQERAYTVCGVAESDALWMLCPAPAGAVLTAIELTGLPAGDPRGAAMTVLRAAGLEENNAALIPGGTLAAAAALLAWLPLAAAGLALAAGLGRAVLSRVPSAAGRQCLGFAAALGFALLLPRILAAVPAWLIPDRWSDFDHWRTLLALPGQTLQSLLAAPPSVRDGALQMELLRAAAADTAALLCAAGLKSWGRTAPAAGPSSARCRWAWRGGRSCPR